MKQQTLAMGGFEKYGKTTRRAVFLAEMDRVVPWSALCALIEPVYPKAGNGRPPIGLERMLRIYFLQNWFNLSDPVVEESLYDSLSMRSFVGIDLGQEGAPDETTVCKFRHLLEQHELGKRLFEEVGRHLQAQGLKVSTGTIVDASIINAPSSTKNADKARDPTQIRVQKMHQTRKGNQWYFLNPFLDKHAIPQLLHGKEKRVYGDSAYASQKGLIAQAAPEAKDFTNQKGCRHQALTDRAREKNRTKSKVRAKVEHAFLVIKRIFGFAKASYRGLAKNGNRLFVVAALANLFMARRHLFSVQEARCAH